MNAADLAQSAQTDSDPPAELSLALQSLWLAKAGRWDESHDLTDDIPGTAGSWIHAYLHREEGDLGNAKYWYHRAGKEMPAASVTLAEEWGQIASALSLS
ncbi:hypothetical protein N9F50_01390 [Akkermansiaceae bacterium]|nr:hypothetical protein [Akkermansiaceae bacterium]MDB4436029.1 hypothetical protein [Akkermansiaceae bacterium]MDB4508321.1 hypothetical protein [Akkermansiaceae bacterium]